MRKHAKTAQQMIDAPRGAVYIWPSPNTTYASELAHQVGREDITVVSLNWLDRQRWRGRELSGVVLDRAVSLTASQVESLQGAWSRVR